MIKTLKSELRLRPTYDELVGMIEDADKENRPPIEKIIDRRATLFRNNQFGSQLDNIDFLGLKKQEEDKVKNELRQVQLRQTAISTGSSMGILTSSGFTTPAEVYEMDDEDDMTSEEATRIRAEMERYLQRQQQAQQTSSSIARSDLDEALRQSLPTGVDFHRMDTGGTDEMPPLETPTEIAEEEEEEEEEEFEDDEEVEVDNNTDLKYWERKTLKQLKEQLELRGIQLDKKQLQEMERLKPKGKGKETTKNQYLLNIIEGLIKSGKWNNENTMKRGKGKGSALVPSQQSSSSTAKDILVSGAKAGVETLAKARATALAKSFLPV